MSDSKRNRGQKPKQDSADALAESNAQRMRALALDGIAFNTMQLRLDMILDHLFPTKQQRDEFEMKFHRELEEQIVGAEKIVNKAKLTAGLGGVQRSLGDMKRG